MILFPFCSSDVLKANRVWLALGGRIENVRRTGEVRYTRAAFSDSIRANGRRKDTPAILLSRINQLLRRKAANDDLYVRCQN